MERGKNCLWREDIAATGKNKTNAGHQSPALGHLTGQRRTSISAITLSTNWSTLVLFLSSANRGRISDLSLRPSATHPTSPTNTPQTPNHHAHPPHPQPHLRTHPRVWVENLKSPRESKSRRRNTLRIPHSPSKRNPKPQPKQHLTSNANSHPTYPQQRPQTPSLRKYSPVSTRPCGIEACYETV